MAQPAAAQASGQDDGWKIAIYPILGWVPLSIGIDVNLPPVGDGGGGSGPDFGGKIVDARFDGAYFGGVSAQKAKFRIDADGLWAAVGGDRVDRPTLRVDVDAIYGHATAGYEFYPDFYVTGGVRRLALKYDIDLAGRQFSRKPGVWDPVVGLHWQHEAGKKLDLHGIFEGGGFGVGTDAEIYGAFRLDWKPATHFGLTGGYTLMYFKLSNTLAGKTLVAKQTMHGPTLGIGLYF
jgi:hypothetical protein